VGNKFHKLYAGMALRHLFAKDGSSASSLRNEGWLRKLEEFIKIHKGKRYRLNPLDLFKNQQSKSSLIRSQSPELIALQPPAPEDEEESGFFCSELVAAAYQYLGILPEERAPSYYWPSTLAREDLNDEMGMDLNLSKLVYLSRD
jgi:hypothetical protein